MKTLASKKRPVRPIAPPKVKTCEIENNAMVAGWRERIQAEIDRQHLSLRGLSAKAMMGNSTVRYLLTSAEDVGLESLRKLANALDVSVTWLATGTHGVFQSDSSYPRNIRVLLIHGAEDAEENKPTEDRGYVAVPAAKTPADAKALLVQNTAMQVEGLNAPVAQGHVVLPGDVVIWSKSAAFEMGELVVARQSGRAVVRRVGQNDNGDWRLLANNASFPQTTVQKKDILGAVVAVWRLT